jgi:hypothetical protein
MSQHDAHRNIPVLTAETNTALKLAFRLFNRTANQVIVPTGYGVVLQVKSEWNSTTALVTASTANGMITIDATAALVKVNIPANAFGLLPRPKPYLLGIQIVSPTGVAYPSVVRELFVTPKFIVPLP